LHQEPGEFVPHLPGFRRRWREGGDQHGGDVMESRIKNLLEEGEVSGNRSRGRGSRVLGLMREGRVRGEEAIGDIPQGGVWDIDLRVTSLWWLGSEEGQARQGRDLGEVDSVNGLSGAVDGLEELFVREIRAPGWGSESPRGGLSFRSESRGRASKGPGMSNHETEFVNVSQEATRLL
jgi:hypothetical protein